MGTSRRPAVETPTLSDGLEENADVSSRSPRFPPRPRLHRSPGNTQFDPGPPSGQEPESELSKHEVLHRQPGHRLGCLGSCSWSWHPVLRQPGVQPVQEPGGTRTSNTKGANTNNRIFGNSNIDNGILGFLGGFAAASVAQNAGLTPNCG